LIGYTVQWDTSNKIGEYDYFIYEIGFTIPNVHKIGTVKIVNPKVIISC